MLFLSLVAVPAPPKKILILRPPNLGLSIWHGVSEHAGVVGSVTSGIITGTILLPNHVDLSESLGHWPPAVLIKLSLVLLLIVVSMAHDQVIGPKVRTLKHKPTSELAVVEKLLLRFSPVISRLTMLLGLGILLAAIRMVRS